MDWQRYSLNESPFLAESFTTGGTVTISIRDLSDDSAVALDSNSCPEITTSGIYKFDLSQITTYPTSAVEYVFVMDNGATTQVGKISLYDLDDQANGANQTTITVNDTVPNPIEGVQVQVWNSAETVLQSISDTNASGQVVVMLNDGSYKVRLYKSLVTFTVPEDLTVSGTTTDTYEGTPVTITSSAGVGECEVSIFSASQRPTVNLASLTGTATIVSLPALLGGTYYPGDKIPGTYDSILGRLYWIVPRGSTIGFKVDSLGIQTENAIPDSASVDYKDL